MSARLYPSMPEAKAAPVVWNEAIIISAVARWVEWWRSTCIPNVYIGNREVDLAVVTPAGRLWAFEIKCSLADWRRDLAKDPWSKCPSRFYYVVPDSLVDWVDPEPTARRRVQRPVVPEWVPPHAGIVFLRNRRDTYTESAGGVTVADHPELRCCRPAKNLTRAALSPQLQAELMRKLGMRYWSHAAPHEQAPTLTIGVPE